MERSGTEAWVGQWRVNGKDGGRGMYRRRVERYRKDGMGQRQRYKK
jgi:hypothetical protein